MKEYLYLWIDHYFRLDDYALHGEDFLIDNQGISLSSKYNISHIYNKKKSTISFKINKNENLPKNFFSARISDIKAVVGRNGSGKTLCLKHLLYRIIAREFEVDKQIAYILIYSLNGKIYYHKSEALDNIYKIGFEEEVLQDQSENLYSSENVFFYTAAFDDTEPLEVFHGNHNISTNALLSSDNETLNNISLKYKTKTNYHNSHVTMEIIRKIFFISKFYEVFSKKSLLRFRPPNAVIIAPSYVDIDNAIIEITENNDKEIKKWKDLKEKIDNFADWFRFAALLNQIRADFSNGDTSRNSFKNFLTPKKIIQNGIAKTLEIYSKTPLLLRGKKIYIAKRDCFFLEVESALSQLKEMASFQKRIRKRHPYYNKDSFFFDLNVKKHREILKKFIESYVEIDRLTPFVFMNWRPQSSGERIFIEFFSRFYYNLLIQEKNDNQNQTENYIKSKKPSDIYLIIDEADLYLHPEWQRNWLSEFTEIISTIIEKIYIYNKPKIQIFISTHSPFIITDFPKENLTLLEPNKKTKKLKIINHHSLIPFGANIYDLLSNGFFLENSIGVFSEEKIKTLIQYKYKSPKKRNPIQEETMDYIENSIGDSVIKKIIEQI